MHTVELSLDPKTFGEPVLSKLLPRTVFDGEIGLAWESCFS
jgi:hypothetical protein